MASSSGGDVPAERAAAAVKNELLEACDGVERLKSFLMQLDRRAPSAELVVDGVLNRLSNAISALDGAGGGAVAGAYSPAGQSDGARAQPSVSSSGNTRKRGFSKRSQRASDQRITATLDDGHIWRKYGQKEIQNSTHPRSYFRCTHKTDQGCNAKRHVQLHDADPSKYVVTYYGDHTCRDPTTIPPVIHAAAEPDDGGATNLISFAPSRADASTGALSSQQLMVTDGTATTQVPISWCTSNNDVLSSSPGSFMQLDDELGAVVGSAAVISTRTAAAAGSAPDNGGTTPWLGGGGGVGTGSFPSSSPNSHGFDVGDDDGFFGLDP